MNQNININQYEVIINEGVHNIINIGRILNEIKYSQICDYEYKQLEEYFFEKWGIQDSELDSIINIFKKSKQLNLKQG